MKTRFTHSSQKGSSTLRSTNKKCVFLHKSLFLSDSQTCVMFLGLGITGGGTLDDPLAEGDDEQDEEDCILELATSLWPTTVMVYSSGKS